MDRTLLISVRLARNVEPVQRAFVLEGYDGSRLNASDTASHVLFLPFSISSHALCRLGNTSGPLASPIQP